MLMTTFARFGEVLAENFSMTPKKQVVFEDKENMFYYLKEQNLPFSLPAISYFSSSVELVRYRAGETSISVNTNHTIMNKVKALEAKCSIDIAIVTDSQVDQLKMLGEYFNLLEYTNFTVSIPYENNEISINAAIDEIGQISTPKEGRDYDRGTYFVMEGSLNLHTLVLYDREYKLIRNPKSFNKLAYRRFE